MVKIIQSEDPVLRKTAKKVALKEIGSKKIVRVLKDMSEALMSQHDGVAIAAPQIGISLRIFVISGVVFTGEDEERKEDMVFINPVIKKLSKKKEVMSEGCLSVRFKYGNVKRHEKASIEAYDASGKLFTYHGSELLAQIFQHETDHLEGVLFIDKASDIRDMSEEKIEQGKIKQNKKDNEIEYSGPKFVYFGSTGISITILDILEKAGFIPGLIVAHPDKPKGRKMVLTQPPIIQWASKRNIPTIQPDSIKIDPPKILTTSPSGDVWDVFIVVSYGKIIPQNILDIPEHDTLNVHPSLLPELRGPSPIQTAILEDKSETGVTIIKLDAEMDHGPIVAQASVSPEPWPIKASLLEDILAQVGGDLLVDTLIPWINGDIEVEEQDHKSATYCSYIKKTHGLISLNTDPYKNYLKIKAFDEWPGAYYFEKHKQKEIRVKITEARFENNTLTIERVIPEGKSEMDYEDFKRGLR